MCGVRLDTRQNHKFIRLLDRLSTQQLGRSLQSCASEEQHQSANRVPYRFCASLVDFPKSFRANEAELRTLESELLARTASAKTAMLATQPPAQIAPDNCNQCDVKHLCSDYWIPHSRKVLAPESRVEFDDVELLIEERLGEQSWRCKCLLATHIPINSSVLLRVGHDNTTLDCGLETNSIFRVVGALVSRAEQASLTISVVGSSELFRVPKTPAAVN